MAGIELRPIVSHERDAVLDLLKEWLQDRDFFARYFRYDPSFRDDLCFVATDGGKLVSTFQVFHKRVRINSAVFDVGGIGNVFTLAAYRGRGIASQLLRYGVEALQAQQFDLSLLFAVRLKFYGDLGWHSHVRHLAFIDPTDISADGPYVITRYSAADLTAVREIYEQYTAPFNGPTVRDLSYWNGQLRYAGNPHEDFLVARAGNEIVAYARGTPLYDFYVIMEHGCRPGYADALVQLVCRLHGTEAAALPGTITQLAIDPGAQQRLQARGLSLRTVEDVFWMWRVLSPSRVAAKLGIAEADLDCDDLFFRLLPPAQSVYWIADRF